MMAGLQPPAQSCRQVLDPLHCLLQSSTAVPRLSRARKHRLLGSASCICWQCHEAASSARCLRFYCINSSGFLHRMLAELQAVREVPYPPVNLQAQGGTGAVNAQEVHQL